MILKGKKCVMCVIFIRASYKKQKNILSYFFLKKEKSLILKYHNDISVLIYEDIYRSSNLVKYACANVRIKYEYIFIFFLMFSRFILLVLHYDTSLRT